MLSPRDIGTIQTFTPAQMIDALHGLSSQTYLTLVLTTLLVYDYCELSRGFFSDVCDPNVTSAWQFARWIRRCVGCFTGPNLSHSFLSSGQTFLGQCRNRMSLDSRLTTILKDLALQVRDAPCCFFLGEMIFLGCNGGLLTLAKESICRHLWIYNAFIE